MNIQKIPANSNSYGLKREYDDILYIVIHYTACDGDLATNQGLYFKNTNKRAAGAHFFVDRKGTVVKSVNMNRTAWSVGGSRYSDCEKTGGGRLYRIVENSNSISIELCDNLKKDPSKAQIEAVKELIGYIRKKCPNAKKVIRHFDVNGKHCPARMMEDEKWNAFLKKIGEKK